MPMLTALQLGNFKSWREVNVALAPITGFFGTNSSGKSSLLQALLLMKQTVDSSDQQQVLELGDESSLIQLGSFRDICWMNQPLDMTLSVSWSDYLVRGKEFIEKPFRFTTVFNLQDKSVNQNFFEYVEGTSKRGYDFDSQYNLFGFDTATSVMNEQGKTKFYQYPKKIVANLNYHYRIELDERLFEQRFSSTFYLGPLRAFPKRTYLWSGAAPSNVGKSGENTIAALLAARVGGNKVGEIPFENYIAQKLKDLGLINSFRLEELREGTNIFRVLVRRTPESPEVSLTDVGFGVSQVLPVLVLCYYVPEGSTILLEQPELHLHPSVQSGLADIFIDAYKTRGVQIILESHSEHLLQRLQRRIAEEAILSSDVNLYFCRLEHGESKLESLELDEYGQIHNYPTDFFGDEFAEIAATTKKIMERKKAKIST